MFTIPPISKLISTLAAIALVQAVTAPPLKAQDFVSQLFGAFWKSPTDHSIATAKPQSWSGNKHYCVRLCDGYYWPVSARQSRQQSEAQCIASCDTPARLFAASGLAPEDMRDHTGKRYGDLPAAFKYRKSYDRTCGCRPAPWSAAEQQRHAQYASISPDATSQKPAASLRNRVPAGELTTVAGASFAASATRASTTTTAVKSKKNTVKSSGMPPWTRAVFGN